MKTEKILLILGGIILIILLLGYGGCGKEKFSGTLSNISGTWDLYNFTGSDFKSFPPIGQAQISDSGGNSFNIKGSLDSLKQIKVVTVSPQRTDKVLYGWVGPIGQITPQTIQFTFTSKGMTNEPQGLMTDYSNNEYILLPHH